MKSALTILIIILLSLAGCKKEARLTPTTTPEDVYNGHTLPQGDHAYDADIVALFNKYNSMFLYKYTPNDLYYNINNYLGGTYNATSDSTVRGGYFDVPPDQAYIGNQLNLLKTIWLNYYPDSLLRQGMPQKVFLVDSFFSAYSGAGKPSANLYESYIVYSGGDFILVTWGSARILSMTPADQYALKGALNAAFLTYAHANGAIKRSPAFTALTDYSAVNYSNYLSIGIIDYYRSTAETDWDAYVEDIVSNSYTTLTSPGNILSPDVDTSGVIMKKYKIVIAWFKAAFGVDLQAIGNAGS